ncbi:MAG TPA: cupin domain-containing protein [Verrucomicrobiae bacterium]|nr:cupin domain-containing protein [Verrucomicrobiae bacterium]
MPKKILIWFSLVIAILICSGLLLFAQEEPSIPKVETPSRPLLVNSYELNWLNPPAGVRKGARVALVHGIPASEPYAQFVKVPRGYAFKPHFHEQDESVLLLSGTVVVGFGDKIDQEKGTVLTSGAYGFIPAGKAHWAVAKTDAMFYQHVSGPASVTYVHPEDDPRNTAR